MAIFKKKEKEMVNHSCGFPLSYSYMFFPPKPFHNSMKPLPLQLGLPFLLPLHHHDLSLLSPQHLLQLHSLLITTGLHSQSHHHLLLLHLCASKPSLLNHTSLLFNTLHRPDPASWRTIIRAHASGPDPLRSLHLFTTFHNTYSPPQTLDPYIYASAAKACSRLVAVREGKSIHCRVLRTALGSNLNILNTLIHLYSNCGYSGSAFNLFVRIPCRNIVTINSMISGFVKNRLFDTGFELFKQMLDGSLGGEELRPNDVTLVILISGCAEGGDVGTGECLHGYCCKSVGFSVISVWNVLIDMYAAFGRMHCAEKMFRELPEKDLVSWNSLIAGYRKNDDPGRSVELFREMRSWGVEGDRATMVSLISACAQCQDLKMGEWVHVRIKQRVNVIPVPIATALITMYCKCGLAEVAREVFDAMPCRNIVTWNSMILGYVETGLYNQALSLFGRMQAEELVPDEVTMLGLISACQNLGVVDHGDVIHSYIQSNGPDGNIKVCNALVDMFAKLGCMDRAKSVFINMPKRDVISWSSMILGYAINGQGRKALKVFRKMLDARIEPNNITFIGVLSACDHAGLVDEGRILYGNMLPEYGVKPEIEHCGCVVDMLARAGLLDEAHEFVRNMPVEPNAVIWRMLIGSWRVRGEISLGQSLLDGLVELRKPFGHDEYIITSNTLAAAERWRDVFVVRSLMGAQKMSKAPGRSSISSVTE